jgi:hypothetical protein
MPVRIWLAGSAGISEESSNSLSLDIPEMYAKMVTINEQLAAINNHESLRQRANLDIIFEYISTMDSYI